MNLYKKKIKFLLLAVSLIIAWSFAGLIMGKFAARLFSPKMQVVDINDRSNKKLKLDSLKGLFGAGGLYEISSKDIKIIGLIAGSNNGAILISLSNGPVRTLTVDEISEDGLIFKGISAEVVNFFFQGQIIKVPFLIGKDNTLQNDPEDVKNQLEKQTLSSMK